MTQFGVVLAFAGVVSASAGHAAVDPAYPYGSAAFDRFVKNSYAVCGGDWRAFSRYMDGKAKPVLGASLPAALAKEAKTVRKGKVATEEAAGRWAHRLVKKTITKFSLDRGFEFANTERYGERQCLLQSVLIAGMLQKTGLRAGVVMVNANEKGQRSFNGHAVVVLHLSNGRDRLVDASEPYPFPVHQGLFMRDKAGRYVYVTPVYAKGDPAILTYRDLRSGRSFKPSEFRCLDVPFLDSMFDYYRGERYPSGMLRSKATTAGLNGSKTFLERSVKDSPANPLAWAMLARTYGRLGMPGPSRKAYERAYALGRADGWIAPAVQKELGK